MLNGPFRLPGDVDLAFVQALAQIVRRQIHQHHFVGGVEKGIGDGFPHLNPGYAADHVIQAFQVLDVNSGKNVNARFEQLLNILPAFGVARAGRIAVRQFVHQDQRRAAGEGGVEIELTHQTPTSVVASGRQDRQAGQ
ncbi:hypothetical protein D3C75_385690 [compost metagenome]